MRDIFFSIVIPVYNVEKYIQKCVTSVLKQKFTHYEIILVNDGSTDNSAMICNQFSTEYSQIVVIHKKNGGLSEARNTGIDNARGKYILFLDGDDFINEDSLENIFKTLQENNYPDILCLDISKYYEKKLHTIKVDYNLDTKLNSLRGDEIYDYLADLPNYPASACTKAVKRELFLNNDLYFIKGLLSEDLEWCIRLFLSAKTFAYCPQEYYFYRQLRGDSISNTSSEKKTMDILSTFIKWVKYAEKLDNTSKKKMICSYMEYIFRFLIIGYLSINKNEKKEYKKKLRQGMWVLGTRKDKKSTSIRMCYKFFKIGLTAILLKKYLSISDFKYGR